MLTLDQAIMHAFQPIADAIRRDMLHPLIVQLCDRHAREYFSEAEYQQYVEVRDHGIIVQ